MNQNQLSHLDVHANFLTVFPGQCFFDGFPKINPASRYQPVTLPVFFVTNQKDLTIFDQDAGDPIQYFAR